MKSERPRLSMGAHAIEFPSKVEIPRPRTKTASIKIQMTATLKLTQFVMQQRRTNLMSYIQTIIRLTIKS